MEKSIEIKKRATHSPEETQFFAQKIAKTMVGDCSEQEGALVFALQGELGSGKTTFAQGFAKALGVQGKVLSPTFVIMKKYELQDSALRFRALYHIDLYRMKGGQEISVLGWDNIMSDPQNVVLVEWPDRAQNLLPKNTVSISFETTNEYVRTIAFLQTNYGK